MEGNLFPRIVPLLAIVIFILIHLPASLCVVNERYGICSRSDKYGNISITYPFYNTWSEPFRPSYCGFGNDGFDLYFQEGVLIMDDRLWRMEITYRVLAIYESTQTVTVARNDYWDSYCPTFYRNTTLDSQDEILGTKDYATILMCYGCPSNITGYANRQFTCVGNRTNTTIGYYFADYDDYSINVPVPVAACNVCVSIPVSVSAVWTLHDSPSRENLTAAIHGGFELIWNADTRLCSACVVSGGRCGSNRSSNNPAISNQFISETKVRATQYHQ